MSLLQFLIRGDMLVNGKGLASAVAADKLKLGISQPGMPGRLIFTPADNANGVATVTVKLHDDGGTASGGVDTSAEQTFTITVIPVNDVPTVVSPIAQVTVDEDAPPVTVDMANVFGDVDIGANADALTLSVSGNTNRGLVTPMLSGSSLTLAFAANQNGSATITVRATDKAGAFVEDSFVVTVNAVNDSPTAQGQTVTVMEDGVLTITLHGCDVETAEASLTFTVTSLPAEGILKSGGVAVAMGDSFIGPPTLTYEPGIARDGAGSDSFTFTVTDRGDPDTAGVVGQTSDSAIVGIDITQAVAEGSVTVDGGVVRIGGTSGDDVILITHTADGQCLQVTCNGTIVSNTIPVAGINEIRAWGRAGNDRIELIDLALMAMLHGGLGNDKLVGGAGNDLLIGGEGNDELTGAAGNDFLIGGSGSDRIVGSAGHDILVAADVASNFTDEALAEDILDETLVDADFDQLTGSSGADWFIIGQGDKVTDFKKQNKDGDLVTVI